MTRFATITAKTDSELNTIRAYLPSNYTARRAGTFEPYRDTVVIRGEDDHGWTLDGYVIPRLASGLRFATEVSPAEYHLLMDSARENDLMTEQELRGISAPDF